MTAQYRPILKAVLVAPVAAPVAMAAWVTCEAVSTAGIDGLRDAPVAALLVFAFGLPASYIVMLTLGLPCVLLLRSRNLLTRVRVYAGAALLGAVVWSGYWQMSFRPPSPLATIPVGAAIGLLVGILFCWVARCGPNDSPTPTSHRGAA